MHYLALGRYNAQGAAGVPKDGLTSRKEILEGLAETTGSRLVGMWGVDAGDIHFVILTEGDTAPAYGAALSLGQTSMGHLAEVRTYTLVETGDVDAAAQEQQDGDEGPRRRVIWHRSEGSSCAPLRTVAAARRQRGGMLAPLGTNLTESVAAVVLTT